MSELILPRRRFLAGLGAIICAPAIVRATSLMPVKAYAIREDLEADIFNIASADQPFVITWSSSENPLSWAKVGDKVFFRGCFGDLA